MQTIHRHRFVVIAGLFTTDSTHLHMLLTPCANHMVDDLYLCETQGSAVITAVSVPMAALAGNQTVTEAHMTKRELSCAGYYPEPVIVPNVPPHGDATVLVRCNSATATLSQFKLPSWEPMGTVCDSLTDDGFGVAYNTGAYADTTTPGDRVAYFGLVGPGGANYLALLNLNQVSPKSSCKRWYDMWWFWVAAGAGGTLLCIGAVAGCRMCCCSSSASSSSGGAGRKKSKRRGGARTKPLLRSP